MHGSLGVFALQSLSDCCTPAVRRDRHGLTASLYTLNRFLTIKGVLRATLTYHTCTIHYTCGYEPSIIDSTFATVRRSSPASIERWTHTAVSSERPVLTDEHALVVSTNPILPIQHSNKPCVMFRPIVAADCVKK